MKYKVNGSGEIIAGDIVNQFLLNRGVEDVEGYKNVSHKNVHHFSELKNIDKAVEVFLKHREKDSHIGVIVDTDVDGFASASILYDYIKDMFSNISIIMHEQKKHGLSSDIEIPKEVQLLLIPDAGSNDEDQSRRLIQSKQVEDIIILDHHNVERPNKYAIVVNPNNCDYPNKYLSGTGVTWKFLQELDDNYWSDEAEKYIDLVALSIISDSMDLKDFENRYLVNLGIENIKNKFFLALIDKASYSLNGIVDVVGIQFYVVPMINAMIRAGSNEDKMKMFDAFCGKERFFPYKKRGSKVEIHEDIYSHVARLCTNTKAKQNREIDKSLETLIPKIEERGWDKNKVMFIDAGNIDSSYTGLVAMKLASQYNRPCLLIRSVFDGNTYSGSGRNIDCDLEDLKGFLSDTGLFKWIQGHNSAFGVSISKNKIPQAIETINRQLENFDFSKTHMVDFVVDGNDFTFEDALEMTSVKEYYGHGFPSLSLVIKNIEVCPEQVFVLGKQANTIKFSLNGVEYIKFNCDENEVESLTSGLGCVTIDLIGEPSLNTFGGETTPQIIINEYEVL